MSYCRGWVYVIRTGDELVCMSVLHLHNDQFTTKDRNIMCQHLAEHSEDAAEIGASVDKACARLREEVREVGHIVGGG